MYSWLRTNPPRNFDEEIDREYHSRDAQPQGGQPNPA
jgi:hypothetical protein